MLIGYLNKADAAALSTDSEIATLPASNVKLAHVAKKWYTAAGVTAAYLIFDLGSAIACDVVALLGTNLTPTGTIRVRASTADPTVVGTLLRDTGVLTGAAKAGYGAIYKSFSTATARYWRIDLSDPAVAEGNLRVGRVFLGPSWTPTVPQLFDWSVVSLDESPGDASYAGQEYDDEKPQRRVLSFTLDYLAEAEMYGNAFALARANGIVRDVLAIPDIAGSYLSEQAVFGKLAAAEPIFHRLPQIYRQKFTVRERL
jgi:hypothetical protein